MNFEDDCGCVNSWEPRTGLRNYTFFSTFDIFEKTCLEMTSFFGASYKCDGCLDDV